MPACWMQRKQAGGHDSWKDDDENYSEQRDGGK